MLNSLKGLMLTLASTFTGLRKPVTRQYPTVPTPVQPRFMGLYNNKFLQNLFV